MKNILTIATIFLLFISCTKDKFTGNGDMITETRNPGTFVGVHTSGSNLIHINYGNAYKVELRGSSNLIPHYESNVVNGKLYLNYSNINVTHDDLEITVTMPAIKDVSLSGNSKIDLNGDFPLTDRLNFSLSGSGDVIVNHNFIATNVAIDISGAGGVNLEKLTSNRADVSISGSGDTRIAVQDKLTANISGSGKIYYTGDASVESHISGSGKVVKF